MLEVVIALGSNIQPQQHLTAALQQLRQFFGPVELSPVYQTCAYGFVGDDFWNLVARFTTTAALPELLQHLRAIEITQGRPEPALKFSSRTLDIDLLLYGDFVGQCEGISLPRDDILRYAFVLLPLSDLMPQARHPVNAKTYQALWQEFTGDNIKIEPLPTPIQQLFLKNL